MTDYEQIAREHRRLYGIDERQHRNHKEMYSDKTHFVYELIQNADDNQSGTIQLEMDEEELIIWNDGFQFTEEDVRSICAIHASNKDLTHIGTFGIGFKSVYNYTDFPEIYSGDERFRIRDLTQPEGIDKMSPRIAKQVSQERTVFRLPFKKKLRQKAIARLRNLLSNLAKDNLLFLRHLQTVQWCDKQDGQIGSYSRSCQPHDKTPSASHIELTSSMNGDIQPAERFLVFRKVIQPRPDVIDELLQEEEYEDEQQRIQRSAKVSQPIEVAFKLCEGQIVAVNNPVLYAYLSTQKETHLRFLIQARYQTTPARDNIRIDTPWNRWLVEETAQFLPEVLEQLKASGLLEPTFFNVLPLLDTDNVPSEFEQMAKSLKDAMMEGSFVPTRDGDYAKAENVFYPHNDRLSKLIDSSSIYPGSSWLHPEIRRNTTAHNVMLQAGVKEVNVSQVLDWLEEQPLRWFKDKPIKWLCSLYTYLSEQNSELERIKKLPLVRLENGDHLCAESEAVFFPPSTTKEIEDIKPFLDELPILSSTFVTLDDQERNNIEVFLKHLGVKASRPENIVREGILPRYSQSDGAKNKKPPEEQNRLHLGYLFKVRDEILREEPYSLAEEISKTPILLAYCKDSGVRRKSSEFIPPEETYLSQTYTGNADLETYFSVCDDVWFVDDGYLEGKSDQEKWIEFLKQIGVRDFPQFLPKKIHAAPEECQNRGFERRSVADGNDNIHYNYIEECTLDGLSAVLHQIETYENVAFSKTLWCLLVKAVSSEESSNRDSLFQSKYCRFYYSWDRKSGNSSFYLDLKKNPWLPDEQGRFHPPSDYFDPKTREVLGDHVRYLHPEFDLNSAPARWLAGKLGVHLNADTQGVLNYLQSLSKESDTIVCVEDVKRLYEFLAEQDELPIERFQEEPLIFTPSPEPRWWLANQVFWEVERPVFGNSRGYLKTHYENALKSFFSTLGVSERASSLDYMRAVREVASREQAGDGEVRRRVKKLYDQLQLDLQIGKLADAQAHAEWEETCNAKCWLGRIGNEWDFFSRDQMIWNDHPQRATFFEGEIPFWSFGDNLSNLAEYLEIVGSSQAKVEFHSHGDKIEDRQWSQRVRDLYPCVHAFLKSPQLGNEKESEPAKILTRLSVCRVAEFEVTYKLNGVHVTDPEPRPSFLDSTDLETTLWMGLDADIAEFPELISDALQDYFVTKELGAFIEDLLTKNQDRVLSRWEAKGLDKNLILSPSDANADEDVECPQVPYDEQLPPETQSEDTTIGAHEPSIEDQTIVDTSGISNGHENLPADETEPETPHPNKGGSRPGGGHWGSNSGSGGSGGHGGGGGHGEGERHEELKTFLAENPTLLGDGLEFEATEYEFTSLDKVDILLKDDYGNPVTVEVESHIRPGNYVGVWQAVKYKHLAAVEYELPCDEVRGILAAPEIPDDVKMKCTQLGIEFKEVS